MNHDEKQDLRRLLIKLQRANLDKPRRKPTFLEVAGVEHREVTISRILAFLLDSKAVHGLGDLWLRSILAAASESDARFDPDNYRTSPTVCLTEVVTANADRSLRIDVLAKAPDIVLGIENKIDANLYNDLEAYAGQVCDMAGDRTPLLVTLTLHDEMNATTQWVAKCEQLGVALTNVTYDALFEHVKRGIGGVMLSADQEWLGYVRDFMRTIENLGEPEMHFDQDLFTFMCENEPEVKMLALKMVEVTQATRAQGERLRTMMEEDEELKAMSLPKPAVWQADITYLHCPTFYHFKLPGRGQWIHVELCNNLSGVLARYWMNKPSAKPIVKKAALEAGLTIEKEYEQDLQIHLYPLDTPEEELVEAIKPLVRAVLPIVQR